MDMAMRECRYTINDIYALPDDERAELIDGHIYYMAAPNRIHQQIVRKFTQRISNYIDSKGGDCEVYPAPFAVFLNCDDKNYLEPDVSVICNPEKLTDKGCNGAPDWIIEVVSQSSRNMDYLRKLIKYQSSGVREYWIVDPDKNVVTVYNYEQETMEQYSFDDEIPAGIYEDLTLTVN